MKTISTLALLIFCLIWGENPPVQEAESPQQNVLFIAMDDLRIQLGCYGQSFMKTPNIDRLAAEGTAFRHAYCNQAICMASRASIMSGIRPEHQRIYTCGALEELAPEVLTLNEHFAAQGYRTTAIGKVYHHDQDHLAQFGENWHDPTDQWAGRGYISDEAIAEMAANGRSNEKKREKGPAYEMADVPDNHYIDGANAEFAITQLEELGQQDQPFFMALGFHRPHLSWCAPQQYWDMYPVDEIDLSPAPDYPSNLTPFSRATSSQGGYAAGNTCRRIGSWELYLVCQIGGSGGERIGGKWGGVCCGINNTDHENIKYIFNEALWNCDCLVTWDLK